MRLVMLTVEETVEPCSTVKGEGAVATEKSLLACTASENEGKVMKASVKSPAAARTDSTMAHAGIFLAKNDIR